MNFYEKQMKQELLYILKQINPNFETSVHVCRNIDAVVVCDATMNEMFEIHAKVNNLIVNLQEVFDDKS